MAYTTRVKLNRQSASRFAGKLGHKRNFVGSKWAKGKKNGKKSRLAFLKSERFRRIFYTAAAIFMVAIFVGALFVFSYVQGITEDLPSPDKPFGLKNAASEIYDRNGKLLYRVFGEANSDPVDIDEVPELLQWTFLAAEDIDFYQHPGFDVTAVVRAGLYEVFGIGSRSGGSTITQQLVKQTALTNERKIERKIKEIILALQIERVRTKDEILEMYLTVAPEGSNIYGIKTAARFYFDKDLSQLNLAEMAILAAIPQNPTNLSPTKSANPEESQKKVKERQLYVLDQMQKYKDLINQKHRERTGEDNDILTQEMIDEARNFELTYSKPSFDIKAPHFVFYVQKLLQQRGYNNGEPFSLSDIETGGYKIYTTLDLDMQSIAEEQVIKGVDNYGKRYGAENAALVAINPKNGEVLAMAGSKNYFGEPVPEGCTLGKNCKFEPNVNITDTLQSFGSSMKPINYYMAFMNGLITPGSQIADIPIKIGNYEPKNYEGGFIGIRSARLMLSDSRNIPAIYLVDQLGVENYLELLKKFGYTTLTNPAGYGPSIVVGGADVKLIEHAQAYTVFANEGKLTQHEVVTRIVDRNGEDVYNAQPVSEQVADPRGVYLINDILNGNKRGPGDSWDGRDVAGKTGTSEDQKETLFVTWTPEIVVVGWLGNNDNTPMRAGASGFGTAKPWIAEFLRRVGGSLPKTPFPRPDGIVFGSSCVAEDGASCEGIGGGDLAIAGIKVPSYVSVSTVTVCSDQKDRLARDIDIQTGFAETIQLKTYKMPNPKMQPFLDKWMSEHPELGAGQKPTEFCDINRNPSGTQAPWAAVSMPTNGAIITDTLSVKFNAYSTNASISKVEIRFDGTLLGTATSLPYENSFSLSPAPGPGTHQVEFKVFDTAGEIGITTVNVEVLGVITITDPTDGAIMSSATYDVKFNYSGSSLDGATLYANGSEAAACDADTCSWTIPAVSGPVELKIIGSKSGQILESAVVNVIIP